MNPIVRNSCNTFLVFMLVLASFQSASSQTISVASFSPQSGPIGTTVVLTGTGFNTTAAQNVVFFGATKALVTAATSTSLTVTVPIGSTYSYISATNLSTALTAYSNKQFTVTVSGRIKFAAKTDFAVGNAPFVVEASDIDGDGKPEVLTLNNLSNSFFVLRNTANSIPGAIGFAAPVSVATGNSPYSMTIGDLNGDGKPDVAVTNYTQTSFSVFINESTVGSISFAARVNFTTGANPRFITIGDLDLDGKPDIAVAVRNTNVISVFRNTTTGGNFSLDASQDFATPASSNPSCVAIGDLDGDGKPDMVATHEALTTGSIFPNTSTPGTISFGTRLSYGTAQRPNNVKLGDIDGDNKLDIVVANYNSTVASVLRNTSTVGSISVAGKVDFPVGNQSRTVCVGDIDGDGKPELVVAQQQDDRLVVLRNTSVSGTVSFEPRFDMLGLASPYQGSICDVNGDGHPDIISANSGSDNISVFAQLPIPVISSFSPLSGPVGTIVTISGKGFSTTASSNVVLFGTVKGVVTTSTRETITVTVPQSTSYENFRVTNLETGYSATSATPFNVTFKGSFSYDNQVDFAAQGPIISLGIADMDNNGKPEVLAASRGTSPSGFVRGISVFGNTSTPGTVSFATRKDTAISQTVTEMNQADLDGDGKPDVIIIDRPNRAIKLYRNVTTTGTFLLAPGQELTTQVRPQNINVQDIDGDGLPDLVIGNSESGKVSIYKNTSVIGSISFAAAVDVAFIPWITDIVIADLDKDGKQDICISNRVCQDCGGQIAVLRNISVPGQFKFEGSNPPVSSLIDDLALVDLDGDNKLDLAAIHGTSSIRLFRNTSSPGAITFQFTDFYYKYITAYDPYILSFGDIDGDGKPDLAYSDYQHNRVAIFKNNSTQGSVSFAFVNDFAADYPINPLIVDIDGDDKPDISTQKQDGMYFSVFRQICVAPGQPVLSTSPATICQSQNSTLSIESGSLNDAKTWEWYADNCGGTSIGSGTSITVSPSVTTTYYVRGEGGCTQNTVCGSVTVTVNQRPSAPTITADGATVFCAGGSVTLTSSPSTGYKWSNGANTQSITVTTSGSYSVQAINSNGCFSDASAVTVVSVNPLPLTPSVTAGGPVTFCSGSSVTLTSGAGTGWLWSNGATTQSIVVSQSGIYSVQVSNASGCFSAASAGTSVTVNALPATPTITAGGATTFCNGGNVTLTSSAGTGYLWSNGGTTQTIIVSEAGSYSVQVRNASGCLSAASAAIAVAVTLPTTHTTTLSVCDSYTWPVNGQAYTASGHYEVVNGCHTEKLDLTITTSTSHTTTATGCDSYTWAVNGQAYTASGHYEVVNGC
ncbi:MAG: FG-GAP-like repeat-containing protein, partial [Bacteroidota bacterium]